MFIFILTYQKPLSEVEKYLEEHIVYLERNYSLGHFIASGRQEPRTGGVIICRTESKEHSLEIIKEDPFYKYDIANYDIIEFIPTKFSEGFDQFIR